MKNLTKLLFLAILVVFASCQNETLTDGASSVIEDELSMEDEILVSDGEEDETFVLDANSEIMPTRELSFSMSSNTVQEGTPIPSSCTPDLEALELSLPDVVSGTITAKPGVDSYFTLDIAGDSTISGTGLAAWCVDQDLSLGIEGPLEFAVYSSYETLPDGEFEFPENFDLVNWVLNQNFIGEASTAGGNYTFGHVQYAMWLLVDDSVCLECSALAAPGDDSWFSNGAVNAAMAAEIAQAAKDNGEGFVPGCGQKVGVILNPAGKQAIIIGVDVPEKEEECSDCDGKVTKLELEFDWGCKKYIKVYQRKENTCYGVKIFSGYVQPGGTFTIEGANQDGTIGRYAYIYINGCYYTKIKTNCDVKIGPGYTKGVFNVISGESSNGGELCEYVKPDYNKCYRHWSCKYYYKCRYY